MNNSINTLYDFGFGTQIRKSPFFDATVRWGAQGFSTYNHMYIPRDFGNPEENFWNLINHAILCDVAVERQVQIKGPDASKFVQMMSPRDLSEMKVGQCKYIILVNQNGGILNDPVLLKIADDCYWFSLADSDILFWAQGLAANSNYDVEITEPDVSPLQLQGPKSRDIMIKLFGDSINDLKYFWFKPFNLGDINLIISRTGWSSELGYEIFLLDSNQGDDLYELLMSTGKEFGLKPGHTSTIRRIEGAMLSYHADMDINTNPFELGLDKYIDINNDFNFIGKTALKKIIETGINRKQVGLVINSDPLKGPNTRFWDIKIDGLNIGKITSAVYSPRLKQNIALGLIAVDHAKIGNEVFIDQGSYTSSAIIIEKPFYDPKKAITKS
ncbi:MAG: glycine cleavage T C-terminal barrel domain-containing protein [SAR86 cluster bacterium]|nr:glycine cleavage T C-terminal barrel domain-containing protein [SAR86 cluster bacterium]MDG1721853.1 glycine cleavage T C-terminal barrel domain-containing protein [SAR86 cluster bacterium]|tara:strand:+ start:5441 stop:6595 length:1155 start_codon:yes stop_codon:yes gene_type:complete